MKLQYVTKSLMKTLQLLVVAVIVVVLIMGNSPVRPVSAALPAGSARPLGELLNPDGTLDLQSGYRGSLDLSGWQAVSEVGQALRFAPLAAGDGHWDNDFGRPGVNNTVNALAVDGLGNLYVGGNFTTAGDAIANYLAMWDGSNWSAVGGGLGAQVLALTIGPDGYLYVGGNFQNAGGEPNADRVAIWDGSSWLSLGAGLNAVVNALAFDSNGNLYAGGNFTDAGGDLSGDRVAMWNGSVWSALGSGFGTGQVFALAVDGNDDLYAGGSFTDAVGDLDYIAFWDGSAWAAVGTGLNNQVNALVASGATDVYVGGNFTDAGGVTAADRIALWSGGVWTALGTGIGNNTVFAMTLDGSDLLVGGSFTDAGGNASADRIAIWTGSEWQPVAAGVNNGVRAIAIGGGGFYAGGDLTLAGAVVADRVVQWDGSAWMAVGSGNGFNNNSIVYALTLDGNGSLYAGGTFTYAGSTEASRVARWDGSAWSVLGSGTNGAVYDLLIDEGGNLYVGGNFSTAGGWTVNSIAKWNGSDWTPLGSPPNAGVTGGQVNSMVMDDMGNLYVAGSFTFAGGQPANRVAKWDGSSWSALGDGFDNTVNMLALDETGNLYAGGNFLNSGSNPVTRLAMWDGSTWSTVGGGLNGQPYVLLFDGNNLYVGGAFTDAGSVANADRIALWDGSAWTALGTGTNGNVRDLAMDGNGTLLVAGEFTNAGGVPANRIARWYQAGWYAMGSGTNQNVYAVVLESDWSIFVGGNFYTAGDKAQAYIARWFNTQPMAVDDSYSTVEEQTLIVPAPGVIENDYDDNDDALMASVIVSPSVGTLDFNADGSFTYTPTLSYDDPVTFTYQIVDEYGGPDSAMVTITMDGVNDAPIAVDDNVVTFQGVPISIPVLANDIDVDDDVLSIDSITGPFYGTATISGTTEVLYDPDPGYLGPDSFYYIVSDGILTDTGKINITIEVNDPPVAQNDSYTVNEDETLVVSAPGVLSNDTDPEGFPLSAILVSDPTHGVLTLNSDGSFTYIPDADYSGSDSFTYLANDGNADSNVVTVSLTITPLDDTQYMYVPLVNKH